MATEICILTANVNQLSIPCPEYNASATAASAYLIPYPCVVPGAQAEERLVACLVDERLDAPFSFFVHVVKLGLALCAAVVMVTIYHSIRILHRVISCVATCGVYWVLYFTLMAFRSLVLVIFIPLTAPLNTHANVDGIAAAGFLIASVVQILAALILFVCLDHERRYRSVEYAVSLGSSQTRCVAPLTPSFKEHVFSWLRLGVVVQCLGSIGLLATLEVVFKEQRRTPGCTATEVLMWVYVASLLTTRVFILAQGVGLVVRRQGQLKPSAAAKVWLALALLFSSGEDLPSFALTHNLPRGCLLYVGTLYDLFQLLSLASIVCMVLFIRSQFNRVEQECCHAMVFEVERLLQIGDGVTDDSLSTPHTVVVSVPSTPK